MFGLWWQALPWERASGLGLRQETTNSFHQLWDGNKGGVGNMLSCEAGKGSCYGGHPEERRLCALKIIIDPHGVEGFEYECCFVFTVYKAPECVCFLFQPEW